MYGNKSAQMQSYHNRTIFNSALPSTNIFIRFIVFCYCWLCNRKFDNAQQQLGSAHKYQILMMIAGLILMMIAGLILMYWLLCTAITT